MLNTIPPEEQSRQSLINRTRVATEAWFVVLISRAKAIRARKKSLTDLTAVEPSETPAILDEKMQALVNTVKAAEELDLEIIRLQQASRTSFKAFRKLHVYFSVRSRLYHSLHSLTYVSQINGAALAIFAAVFVATMTAGFGSLAIPKSISTPTYVKAFSCSPTVSICPPLNKLAPVRLLIG